MTNTRSPVLMGAWIRTLSCAVLLAAPTAVRADIGYQFVTVGNPGNAADTTVMVNDGTSGYGSVGYTYNIGKYDVTLNQYTTFLNAVAQADPFHLYDSNMATNLNIAGINQTGSSGSYSYAVIGDGQRPVTYVSWFDAARFSNWLQNGQPTGLGEAIGSTEQGAYTLNGVNSGTITKNANAQFWIPTESEWYKAAYYDPTLNGGSGGYWTYATKSNTAPGNNASNPALSNQANYRFNNGSQLLYSVTQSGSYSSSQNYLTDVGAFTNSASYYGTSDQSGEVFEWNDAVIGSSGTVRGQRGGFWNDFDAQIQSTFRSSFNESTGDSSGGFRIATVPEPSAALSLVLAGGLLLSRRKRPSGL